MLYRSSIEASHHMGHCQPIAGFDLCQGKMKPFVLQYLETSHIVTGRILIAGQLYSRVTKTQETESKLLTIKAVFLIPFAFGKFRQRGENTQSIVPTFHLSIVPTPQIIYFPLLLIVART